MIHGEVIFQKRSLIVSLAVNKVIAENTCNGYNHARQCGNCCTEYTGCHLTGITTAGNGHNFKHIDHAGYGTQKTKEWRQGNRGLDHWQVGC